MHTSSIRKESITIAYISYLHFHSYYQTAKLEIEAVCALPQRSLGKFRAPPNNLWEVSRMYVNVPEQYNVVMKLHPKPSNYRCDYDEEFGEIHPLNNDGSEDSYYLGDDSNEIPVDNDYKVKYNDSDESESSNNHDDGDQSNTHQDDDVNSNSRNEIIEILSDGSDKINSDDNDHDVGVSD